MDSCLSQGLVFAKVNLIDQSTIWTRLIDSVSRADINNITHTTRNPLKDLIQKKRNNNNDINSNKSSHFNKIAVTDCRMYLTVILFPCEFCL